MRWWKLNALEAPGYTSTDPNQIHIAMEQAREAANVLTEPLDPGDEILWRCYTVLLRQWEGGILV